MTHEIPGWILLWLLLTAVVCTWDAGFILFRPHSLPGGKYHHFWKPYSIYVEVDTRYKDLKDTFVYAVSLMNLVEVALNIVAIILHYAKSKQALPLAFTVCVMTWWKTVLYLLQYLELAGGGEYQLPTDLFTTVLYFWIPNGLWIAVPFLIMMSLWKRMVKGPQRRQKSE